MADYYKTLGVSKDADSSTIKSTYRKLAKEYHPDKNRGNAEAERKFKDINAAYDVLKDDQKRAAYDRYGEDAFNGTQRSASAGGGFGGFDFSSSGFGDIFEDLFSSHASGRTARGGQRSAVRGSDLRYNLEISLEDAYYGKKKTITVNTHAQCESCSGSGSADKHSSTNCGTCQGAGRVRVQQGFFTIERTCTTCQGAGVVIKNPCRKCRGQGRIKKQKTLSMSIPKGVEEGTRIRLTGEGEAGVRGGEAGDIYVFISIKPHKLFIRDGNDIHCKVPIAMTSAALGGAIEVPALDGTRVKINIPSGTQTDNKFRLRGKGMTSMRSQSGMGDMYVHVNVETPVKLSKKQKELLKEFEEVSAKESNPATEGFFTKVKDFLRSLE